MISEGHCSFQIFRYLKFLIYIQMIFKIYIYYFIFVYLEFVLSSASKKLTPEFNYAEHRK